MAMPHQFSPQFLAELENLDALTIDLTERDIIQAGVRIAQSVTSSDIAYLHFVNEDQITIELGCWSHDTLQCCRAVYSRHYPIDAAGIWADSARTGKPCIHNDYAAHTNKGGLPDGHVRLVRHLGLPVNEGERVRMLIGVGNKSCDYNQDDVGQLEFVARRVWSAVRQRRIIERYIDLSQRFRHVQEIANAVGLEYDLEEDQLAFDEMFPSIFDSHLSTEIPTTLHGLLAFVVEEDRETVRQALTNYRRAQNLLKIRCQRLNGQIFPAELKVEFRARELGKGVMCIGILQDISERAVIEELRRRADMDPLTGLPNRNRLKSLFDNGFGQRQSGDGIALHYIDLDRFKPVNDTFGHAAGDEVLRVVAERLAQVVRKDDLVVRMGGDEFAVIQTSVGELDAVRVLADKVIAAVTEPIFFGEHRISVGVSIGSAFSNDVRLSLCEWTVLADRALYEAKTQGGCRAVVTVNRGAGSAVRAEEIL